MDLELRPFTKPLIERGLQYDPQGLQHTHTKIDSSAAPPPMKLHLCTKDLRPEARMLQDDIDMIGELMWLYAKRMGLDIKALASVPRVGDEIANAFLRAAARDRVTFPKLMFSKYMKDGISLIGPVTDDAGYPKGKPVCIIDDLVNGSVSKSRMIDQVIQGGWTVKKVLVFIDYDRGAGEKLRRSGVTLHRVSTFRRFLYWGLKDGLLTVEKYRTMIRYLETPH